MASPRGFSLNVETLEEMALPSSVSGLHGAVFTDAPTARTPIVNVLVHGYALGSLDRDYSAIQQNWDRYGERLTNSESLGGDYAKLDGKVATYVSHWRSAAGWESAFASLVGWAAIEAVEAKLPAVLKPYADQLQDLFTQDAQAGLERAKRQAYLAAERTVADLLTPRAGGAPSLLGTPGDGQFVQVIGHSRGGAVGAEVVRLLQDRGYNVSRFVALDGYSTDWPAPSNVLGDISITDTIARGGAASNINYRVEQGLNALLPTTATGDLTALLGKFLGTPVTTLPSADVLAQMGDWKAPERAGFVNIVMPGEAVLSNHETIRDLFFNSSFKRQFNPYDAMVEGLGSTPATISNAALPPAAASTLELADFHEGNFDVTGRLRSLVTRLGALPLFNDAFANQLAGLINRPGFGSDAPFDLAGDASVVNRLGNWLLQLKQAAGTQFTDAVRLLPTAQSLSLKLAIPTAGAGDELVITFNGNEVGRVSLGAAAPLLKDYTFDVTRFAGQFGEFKFTVNGPDADPATVLLDGLKIVNDRVQPQDVNAFATGTDAGATGVATMHNADGSVRFSVTPYGDSFTGGVRAAAADVTGDGTADLIVSSGTGTASNVRVYDGVSHAPIFDFSPFGGEFTRGVNVSAGDLNGDGRAEIVLTAERGGGARVRIVTPTPQGFRQLADFIGLIGGDNRADTTFRGGGRATVGDFNGDGFGDLVFAAGAGGGPRVAIFDGLKLESNGGPKLRGDFFAFEQSLRDGSNVAAGDFDFDGLADLVAGAGNGGGPRVSIFSGAKLLLNQEEKLRDFFAGDPVSRGGVRVSVKNLDNDTLADLVTGAGPGGGTRAAGYLGANLNQLNSTLTTAFNLETLPGFMNGVFVG